jgi:hypothetical protein
MQEIWKDIEGYEGYYQVSNMGGIRSITRKVWTSRHGGTYLTRNGKLLSIAKDRYGYHFVRLSKDNISKNLFVHRLVAIAFIPNPNNLPIINHKNETKTDNRVQNLEWCTVKYNDNYGGRLERIYNSQRKAVVAIPIDGGPNREYESIRDAALDGFNKGKISECCNGKCSAYRGYHWKFA